MKYSVLGLKKIIGISAKLRVRVIDDSGEAKEMEVDVLLDTPSIVSDIEKSIQSVLRRERNIDEINRLVKRGEAIGK